MDKRVKLVLIALLLTYSVNGNIFEREDPYRYAYGCLNTGGTMKVACARNELMTIDSVLYGGEPNGCNTVIREDNGCLQYSATVTAKAAPLCDGKQSCDVPIVPLKSLNIDEVISVKNNCPIDGELIKLVKVNFMQVKFTCQEFVYCTSIEQTEVSMLTLVTEDYPLQTVTNPTCDCEFTSQDPGTYIQANTQCNGTVSFILEESIPDPEAFPDYKTITKNYYCDNQIGYLFMRLGTVGARSLKVKVDSKNSSEESSFSMTLLTYTQSPSGGSGAIRRGAKTGVTCSAGRIWLTYTTRLILYITIPLGLIILIALIVLYCICKKRRKRAKAWRRQNVPLPYESESKQDYGPQSGQYNGRLSPVSHIDRSYYPPGSPMSSAASSPPSSRKKPDGKLDSESEDDLAEFATLLHRQNTERRQKELEQREKYNTGDPGGVYDSRPYIPRSPSPYTNLDKLRGRPRGVRNLLYAERRCMSIGNLRQPRIADASIDPEDPPSSRPLKGTKSASHSRTSLRSTKRRAPQPPSHRATRRGTDENHLSPGSTLVYVPGHYEEVPIDNHDEEDPDLMFDDPRYGSRNRLYSPRRDSMRRTPSHSRGDTPTRSRAKGAEPRHHDSPHHSDNQSIIPNDSPEESAQSSPRGDNNNQSQRYKKKPPVPKNKPDTQGKYFNPYAVRPPKKSKGRRVSNAKSIHGKDDDKDLPMPDMPRCEHRRYSENDVDDSDHEFEDLEQVGVMDGVDGDLMDEDVGW